MIRIVSFVVALAILTIADAPLPGKVIVKNYSTGGVIAATVEPVSLLFPGLKRAPSTLSFQDEHPKFPEIISGKIVYHIGKKFMCGRAKSDKEYMGSRRYVIALETDWQIWEPAMTDDTWEGWNTTYEEICKEAE